MNHFRRSASKGFTLVELLVVISIIALLVAIVLPAINNALFRGKLTATSANGRSIQQAIFAKDTESVYTTTATAWPSSDTDSSANFTDSSEYFISLVTNGTLNVGLNFFTAPGIPVAPSQSDFESDLHNAWCVTEDVDDTTPDTLPILFTRNLDVDDLGDTSITSEGDEGRPSALNEDYDPFSTKGFVFVTRGGAAYSLFKDDLRVGSSSSPGPFANLFNVNDPQDDGNQFASGDFPVLRPAGD